MRRFDTNTGAEMFVSEYRTNGLYEWTVINGHDQLGSPIEVASGTDENYVNAIKVASEIYEQVTMV